jgi:hypothetical protein
LASVVDQPDRGYSDVFIDPNARPAEFLRTAVKKSSSYIFGFSKLFFPNFVEMGRIELPSKSAAQKIFYKLSLFVL